MDIKEVKKEGLNFIATPPKKEIGVYEAELVEDMFQTVLSTRMPFCACKILGHQEGDGGSFISMVWVPDYWRIPPLLQGSKIKVIFREDNEGYPVYFGMGDVFDYSAISSLAVNGLGVVPLSLTKLGVGYLVESSEYTFIQRRTSQIGVGDDGSVFMYNADGSVVLGDDGSVSLNGSNLVVLP